MCYSKSTWPIRNAACLLLTSLVAVGCSSSSTPVTSEDPEGPDNADPVTTAAEAFSAQLEGARSYGCSPGAEGQFTTEFVEVFTDGITTSDTWLYEEPECVTRPLSFTTALSLQSVTLENPVLTADGREAFAVMLETLQLSSEADEDDFPVGTVLFDILAVEQGGITEGTDFATTAEDRPSELASVLSAAPIGDRAEPASPEGLMSTWLSACFSGNIRQRTFGEQQFIENIQSFAENTCETPIATIINTWDVTYLDPITTVFGQSAMRTTMELVDSRYDDLVIDSNLPAPPSLSEVGLRFEDIWSIIDNELVIGTCLDKRIGDCGVGVDNIPTVLNFNIGNRFVRQL